MDQTKQGVRTGKSRLTGADMRHKALYRVPEAMEILSLTRSVMYEQLRSGRLRSVRVGRTRLITAAAIAAFVALLEREAGNTTSTLDTAS